MAQKPKTSTAEPKADAPAPDQQDTPQTLTVFTPPHPSPGVWRVLKQAYREYHSGPGAVLMVTTPATHAAAAATVVAGTLEIDAGALTMPAAVSVSLTQGGTVKATQSAPVGTGNPAAYTTSFPGATLVAGTATATVVSQTPDKTGTTPAFTLT